MKKIKAFYRRQPAWLRRLLALVAMLGIPFYAPLLIMWGISQLSMGMAEEWARVPGENEPSRGDDYYHGL